MKLYKVTDNIDFAFVRAKDQAEATELAAPTLCGDVCRVEEVSDKDAKKMPGVWDSFKKKGEKKVVATTCGH